MNPKEYSAAEAKRLLEELAPYFADLERQVLEEIVNTCSWDEDSDRKRRCLSDQIVAIRKVQARLKSVIAVSRERASGVV